MDLTMQEKARDAVQEILISNMFLPAERQAAINAAVELIQDMAAQIDANTQAVANLYNRAGL